MSPMEWVNTVTGRVRPAELGMTLVHDIGELTPALDLAFHYDTVALVESYLAGARDLEVSIIGNDPAHLELYGPGEIVSGHEFYDYAAKYTPGLSETNTHAEVTAELRTVDGPVQGHRMLQTNAIAAGVAGGFLGALGGWFLCQRTWGRHPDDGR